jgi:recombinational DNA repair protein (RecF pathway)
MVGSYLICDACGQFGPPASFLSENGLRLCYQCWYQERLNDESPAGNGTEAAPLTPPDPERSDRSDEE